ncbi:hypothetical protein EV122DRAFT_225923, partial [Schizophyllum commune]
RDTRPVLSTARSSTHRTGEFAVLGSARGAQIDVPRPSRPRWGAGMPSFGSGAHSQPGSRARADAPPCDSATCHTRALALSPSPTVYWTPPSPQTPSPPAPNVSA